MQIAIPKQTMSSREIAELVESRHDNVKRSMETLRDKGIISFTQSEETSHDGACAVDVPDPLYGTVKSWPADAWGEIYNVDLQDLFRVEA